MGRWIVTCVWAVTAGCVAMPGGPGTAEATSSPSATETVEQNAAPPSASASNPELRALFDADQADRRVPNPDFKIVSQRDAERRARVLELLDGGGAASAEDFLHAAMIFQHGESVEEIERAHTLALEAVRRDDQLGAAKWLAAASKDRVLMRQGRPQLYGTQFVRGADGRWALHPVDPSISDEERARWGVPPLETAKERLEQMNARMPPR